MSQDNQFSNLHSCEPFHVKESRRDFLKQSAIATGLSGLMSSALASVTSAQTAHPSKLDTLVVAVQEGDTRTIDPDDANELTVPLFLRAIYDQMVTFSGSDVTRVIPGFATKWNVSSDGLTYVFALNPNIKFSDGKPATPEDVIFSFNRQKNLKGPASWFQNGLASIEKTGSHEVTIKLNSINVDWLFLLTSPFLSVESAAIVRAHGGTDADNAATTDTAVAWLDQHSAGSGPFVLESWEHGSQLVMTRNPYYWGKPPPFNRVVFRFVQEATVQRDLLVRGDVHFAMNLSPEIAASLKGQRNIGVLDVPSLATIWLGVNVNINPALKHPKSWEAIKYAIDYDGMARLYKGGGRPISGCLPPGLPNALPLSERIKRDLPRAKAALAAAGYPNGFSMVLTYASGQLYYNVPASLIAAYIQENLQQAGIKVNLRPVPSTQELTEIRAGKLEAFIHEWGLDYVGWTDVLPPFAPGGHIAGPRQGWYPSYSPEAKKIADLATQATKTLDAKEQRDLCYEAQRLMNKVGPFAWLFEPFIQIGYRTDIVKSASTNPVWYIDVGTVELT
jgi:peptide/nickel transport system substrate-binding protein